MAESRGQIPFVEYDVDGRLDQDLPCLKCGYNLRTLRDDAQCPECGASVHESARLAWLCQHDPPWLRRLARSTIWIGTAMIGFILYLSFALWASLGSRSLDGVVVRVVVVVAVIGGLVAGLIGFWQITSPPRDGDLRGWRVRRVARWAMAAGPAGLLLGVLIGLIGPSQLALSLLVPCGIVFLGVGAWATLTYAAALAAKIPETRLVKQVRLVAWGFAPCFSVVGASFLIQAADQLTPASVDATMETMMSVTCAVMLILSIWTIPLLVWYRRRFREALAISQRQAQDSGR